MRLLILGGTIFLGRPIVRYAIERGHQVTLFNRGRSNPGLFPGVESVAGNRDGDIGLLGGRTWDAVIDTCGYLPRIVRNNAEFLKDAAGHYSFVSSLSVYADNSVRGADESSPVAVIADESAEQITNESYGPLKALCEQAVQQAFGENAMIARPGLIVGPHDPSDRFTYWVERLHRGGRILAPGRPERVIQYIDVRDLGEWIVRMAEGGFGGVYNTVGPEPRVSMGELLGACRDATDNGAELEWVDEQFLEKNEVGPWMEMPLWLPESDRDSAGFFYCDIRRSLERGMTFRSTQQTVGDTLEWSLGRPADRRPRAGMTPEREAELLEKWDAVGIDT